MHEGVVCERCGDTVEIALVSSEGKEIADDNLKVRVEARLVGASYHRVLHLKHEKGEDPGEWPPDLRVQEWPTGASYVWGSAA
jgi:hypothetical protein